MIPAEKLVAHRTNTIPRLQEVRGMGITGIEADVTVCATKRGFLFLVGHPTVFKGAGLAENEAGHFEGEMETVREALARRGHPDVPALEDYLEYCAEDEEMHLFLEIKATDEGFPREGLLLIKRLTALWKRRFSIISFSRREIRRAMAHGLDVGILTGDDLTRREFRGLIRKYAPAFYLPEWTRVRSETIQEALRLDVILIPHVVNERRAAEKLIARGVQAVITDTPEEFLTAR